MTHGSNAITHIDAISVAWGKIFLCNIATRITAKSTNKKVIVKHRVQLYTVGHKKRATLFGIITSMFFRGGCLHFLHQWKQEKMLYRKITKFATLPQLSLHYLRKFKNTHNSTFWNQLSVYFNAQHHQRQELVNHGVAHGVHTRTQVVSVSKQVMNVRVRPVGVCWWARWWFVHCTARRSRRRPVMMTIACRAVQRSAAEGWQTSPSPESRLTCRTLLHRDARQTRSYCDAKPSRHSSYTLGQRNHKDEWVSAGESSWQTPEYQGKSKVWFLTKRNKWNSLIFIFGVTSSDISVSKINLVSVTVLCVTGSFPFLLYFSFENLFPFQF